jgi:hypothetical protein
MAGACYKRKKLLGSSPQDDFGTNLWNLSQRDMSSTVAELYQRALAFAGFWHFQITNNNMDPLIETTFMSGFWAETTITMTKGFGIFLHLFSFIMASSYFSAECMVFGGSLRALV